ncbi:hypothetical protein [Shigella boydii]|uniref:hypothetical protein n=1 Tax=Shigella boydii TaxID=621 RepID=UPI001070F9CD|nr:hypothetical protein [Shigella boydii]
MKGIIFLFNIKYGVIFEGYYIPIQYKERGEAAFKKGGDMVAQFESIDEVREALGAEMVSKEDTKHR